MFDYTGEKEKLLIADFPESFDHMSARMQEIINQIGQQLKSVVDSRKIIYVIATHKWFFDEFNKIYSPIGLTGTSFCCTHFLEFNKDYNQGKDQPTNRFKCHALAHYAYK